MFTGNLLSEWIRDILSAAIIYCGHVGAEEAPPGARCRSRAEFYLAQIQRTRDVRLHPLVSSLVGGLDHQIEHHLFPRLPPHRLRAMRPAVQAICEAHGVPFVVEPWSRRLVDVMRVLTQLRHQQGGDARVAHPHPRPMG